VTVLESQLTQLEQVRAAVKEQMTNVERPG
jgi:hypothetical protein